MQIKDFFEKFQHDMHVCAWDEEFGHYDARLWLADGRWFLLSDTDRWDGAATPVPHQTGYAYSYYLCHESGEEWDVEAEYYLCVEDVTPQEEVWE